ncbi:hypothetical protein NXX04_03595 [Bacteroides ovatus]|nr:hypothetical protein [Bacteroides ovatus]
MDGWTYCKHCGNKL